ncbi:VWA domain-containing protein [Candidatus Poribacteria bacterium]|nr:VWA domain-containing protein [Candidatus Poribacteria bacterium]MYG05986.1 VWA domain-containing protein [Candidatus Poribacteria bacterium]MYK22791.1 VWA domain-containing protein [Candidatus Poribacteria bacterium]
MKSKSSKAFLVSVLLHLGVGVLGFFYWFSTAPMRETSSINALFVKEEKPKVRRVTPPKRAQIVQNKTRDVSQQRLKILTSNAPVSSRGVVSAAEPAPFQQFDNNDLVEPIGPTATSVDFDNVPRVQKVIERPFVKEEKVETRYKSRLVKFIEAQEGPQRIVYCVDLSTSMQNLPPHKLKKIIDLMRDSLTFLEPHDSFNIVAFSTELVVYKENFVPVTDETVAASSNYLADIQSQIHTKGTDHDMLTALTETAETSPTLVVLFSDGIPTTIEGPDLTLVGQYATGNGRIFAMGIGMSPNFPGAVMLKRLATVSQGDLWLVDRGR